MKRTLFCITIVLGGVFFLSTHAEAATYVSGDITDSTTWSSAGSPYILTRNITVSSSLTIQEGTVVKIGTGYVMNVASEGSLTAEGVVFTSVYDDEHGGKVDGEPSTQQPTVSLGWGSLASWGKLSLEDCEFFYGGRANRAMAEMYDGTATLTGNSFRYANNVFIQNGGTATVTGNSLKNVEQYGVWQKSGVLTFGKNSFENISRDSYLLTKETFTNEGDNSGSGGIHLQNIAFTTDKSLATDDMPYEVTSATISAGTVFTIEKGNIIKFRSGANVFLNNGTLQTKGTEKEPVILTSWQDDTVGGDTNKDGSKTEGQKGQWTRVYNQSTGSIDFSYTTLRNGGAGSGSEKGLIINYGTFRAAKSVLSDSATRFILAQGGSVEIEKSELLRSEEGIVSNGQAEVEVHNSDLLDTNGYRILNSSSGKAVDASNNYWGNETGPVIGENSSLEPSVSTNVLIDPYLTGSSICKVDCFSNVLFFPGIMGSRLYETQGSDEDELWFSSLDDRQERMEMKSDGTSKYDVYTKEGEAGTIDAAYGNLYQSFLNDLAAWKIEGLFNNYVLIPYDWRLSLEDIVMNGWVENGKLRYTAKNTDITKSYLYNQAKALQQSSKSEKITLIGHSNGGLVIKAFIQKLKETNDPLYEQIDKVIFVGVPQTGTPDSVVSLLYGSKIGILWIGTSAKRARFLAHDMPTMYNLLPSQKLFDQLDPLIEFKGDNVPAEWKERYGNSINSYEEFEDFLKGEEGRKRPEYKDLLNPEILSGSLFDQAKTVHDDLDNWSPSPNTEIIQIAGWGLYTVAGLEVVDDKECEFDIHQFVDRRPVCRFHRPMTTLRDKQTLDGDQTVLAKSAHDMPNSNNVKKYWVDLYEYNNLEEIPAIEVTHKKHKNILEVDTLRYFIRSLIKNTPQVLSYITTNEPSIPINAKYTEYKIHSPLNLTVVDEKGNKTGWDAESGTIEENIRGAQYAEVGEIKTILMPKDKKHLVALHAYDTGSFTLDITELQGEQQVSETQFVAIPVLKDTVVKLTPEESGAITMDIDFNNDGTAEMALLAQPGEEVEYPNPVQENETLSSGDTEDDTSDKSSKKKGSSGSTTSLQTILDPLAEKGEVTEPYFQLPVTGVGTDQESKKKQENPTPKQSQSSAESQNLLAYGVAVKGVRLERFLLGLRRILKLKK